MHLVEEPGAGRATRLSLSAVAAGVLVACACQAVIGLAAAAIGLSLWDRGYALGAGAWPWGLAGLAACHAGCAWIGARVAAVNARQLLRRDGALTGLVTWAALLL